MLILFIHPLCVSILCINHISIYMVIYIIHIYIWIALVCAPTCSLFIIEQHMGQFYIVIGIIKHLSVVNATLVHRSNGIYSAHQLAVFQAVCPLLTNPSLSLYIHICIYLHVACCLLLFYILASSKVISGRVLTWDSTHLWRLNSAATLGNQPTSTMTWYPT